MSRETLISGVEYELLLKEFILFANRELGKIKVDEILKNFSSSEKIAKFLFKVQRLNIRLGTDDFLGCIHSSRSFVFSKAETISVAAIALLMKWDQKVGKPNGLSDDIYLNKIFFRILDKCDGFKTHLGSGPNFFERFNDHLLNMETRNEFKSDIPVFKTEITFDSILCSAILSGKKREFRVRDNLEYINRSPNVWKLDSYDNENGAVFSSDFLDGSILVNYPYKPGSIINVYDLSNTSRIHSQIKILGCHLQRFRDVDPEDCNR